VAPVSSVKVLVLHALFVCFNVIDAYLTAWQMDSEYAYEANPIMRWLMVHHGGLAAAMLVKIIILIGATWIAALALRGRARLAWPGLVVVTAAYGLLTLYHLVGLALVAAMT
jgi:hypothetical protein